MSLKGKMVMKNSKNVMEKSPALYIFMFSLWTILVVFLWYFFINGIIHLNFTAEVSNVQRVIAIILLSLNGVFISYFWLNGVKDFIYVIWYYVMKSKLVKRHEEIILTDVSNANDRILFLYCTCNDFDGYSLEKCLHQNYKNYRTVICDDSSDEAYKKEVDEFAKKHNIEVVRRDNRVGFKAGNINNYLMREDVKDSYDYVVILDSDEIVPDNFITESLKYFYKYENIGIVQANHISTRNRNFFMKLFHIGVNSHWPTYQTMKHFYGFSTMLGHGAMIKKDCYEKAGGFPNLVAEDLCLSIEARASGYYVAFAPNIICEEEYPIDYVAFKKRHSKWTQGNLEFIKNYTKRIIKSPMKWYEKWDIVLFTYNLPLTAVFAFFIFANLLLIPLLHINPGSVYKLWMIIPTIIFFLSPMLNDFITWITKYNPIRNIFYFFNVFLLYGSMLTTSLISALLGMFGKKAKFIVTPKTSQKASLWFALRFQWKEFAFSAILLILAFVVNSFTLKAIAPVILITVTGILSFILIFFSNKKYNKEEIAKIDAKSAKVSLDLNKTYQFTQKLSSEREVELEKQNRVLEELDAIENVEGLDLNTDGQMIEETDEPKDENEVQDSNENQTTEQIENQ